MSAPSMKRWLARGAAIVLLALGVGCVLDWDPRNGTSGSGGSSGQLTEKSCTAGATCALTCPEGRCLLRCGSTAQCAMSCAGGDCVFHCENTSECGASCQGGGCAMHCDNSPSCHQSCSPGDCTQVCSALPGCTCDGCG